MIVFFLTWLFLGLVGLYSSVLWFNFFRKVRELTDTRWVWGFLAPSPVFALYCFFIGFYVLSAGLEVGVLLWLGAYLGIWILDLAPYAVAGWAGNRIPEWGDLRYSLESTNLTLFNFLNKAQTGGDWDNTVTNFFGLVLHPLVFPFAALFARIKVGISPPETIYPKGSGGEDKKGGLYSESGDGGPGGSPSPTRDEQGYTEPVDSGEPDRGLYSSEDSGGD